MPVGSIITAARYNNLQARVSTILGKGANDEGYGQDLRSSEVLSNALVTATDMGNLYVDMIRCRVHQVGTIPNSISNISRGDIIKDDDVAPFDTNSFRAYENLMLNIEVDKFLIAETQASVEQGLQNSRSTAWNGTIFHEFKATFLGYTLPNGQQVQPQDHIRHFFNSGGQIRIVSNITGGTGQKTIDWRSMLVNSGSVHFDYTKTTNTGSGTGSLIGNYDLTSTYQQIFRKNSLYYAYGNNAYIIYARRINTTEISFRVEYNDFDTGFPNVDENVNGILTNSIQTFRASGNYVNVPGPLYATISSLT